MNLSCTGGGLPESGCLFFKVGGNTNLTKGKSFLPPNKTLSFTCTHNDKIAKFADRVPGTIQTPEDHMITITIGTVSSTTHPTTDHEIFSYPQTSNSSSTIPTMPHSSTSPSCATVATNLTIYVISAVVGGVATLLLVVILLCVVLVYCAMTDKTNTAATTTNNNKDNEDAIEDQGLAP